MGVAEVTDGTFAAEVMAREEPVLVEFWAQWCGPCHMVAPVLAQLAEERDDLVVCKVNADENAATARDMQVMSLPTMLLVHRGEVVRTIVGARPKARLVAEVEEALAALR
ncbi:thioredoxin [Actinokineospora bangkokensis]|uniref:Thioredoxin n=1 Tax=Actinokineospora bangkokensis TaxID=1193682 RepID=A0A1Q9LRE0_9PSEU|nr:thioredoxin [Actinokineospora bangkokensis]OLR94564.1 thioredoxin [Actinokineospora bangkokensis]